MMTSIARYQAQQDRFIDEFTPLLYTLDVNHNENCLGRTATYVFGGKHYDIQWVFSPFCRGAELRIHATTYDPKYPRTEPGTAEFCFMFCDIEWMLDIRRMRSRDVIFDGRFLLREYQIQNTKKQFCIYCGAARVCWYKNHEKTKKHARNRAGLESYLCEKGKLPRDCALEILSYLG